MGDSRSSRYKLLGISGSLRRASASTAVLRAAAERLPPDVELSIASIGELPLYNEDDRRPETIAAVNELNRAIDNADGLVVASPEYNHGIPGVLANAIDWVSRPGYESVLKHKPVLVISTSKSPLGGARAQLYLRELFAATLSRVIARRQVVVGAAPSKIVDGRFVHEPTLAFIDDAIADLLDEIAVFKARPLEPFRGPLRQNRYVSR
jgi:chromate reductase